MISVIPMPNKAELAGGVFTANGELTFEKKTDASIPKEGYRLTVKANNITIEASDERGFFYGNETLKQLAKGTNSVPCCVIEDAPRFAWRGFMLDCARHYWSIETIKETLDMMSSLKLNVFHWHLTDDQGWRIEIKKYPLLSEKGTTRASTGLTAKGVLTGTDKRDETEYGRGLFYTQEQAREIVAYAKKLNIDIVPEIDMPGHLVSAIACYPNLSCDGLETEVSVRWGVMDNIGCCGKEDVYTFAKDVIDELLEVFPFEFFHIGGDEVPKTRWKTCPKCQAKIKELGLKDENALQGYFNSVIGAHLKEKGRRMIGWNEITESEPGDNAVVQWWISLGRHASDSRKWVTSGRPVILSEWAYMYLDHSYAVRPLKKTYSYDLDKNKLSFSCEKNVLGFEAPLWCEYIRNKAKFDLQAYPRMQAVAEIAWTSRENRNYASFEERLKEQFAVMDKRGIGYAKPKVYNGKRGFFKRLFVKTFVDWAKDPQHELELNK